MATKKKLLQAAAGTAAASGGAGGLNVEQVFSTYLYEGSGSALAIENGIALGDQYDGGSAKFTDAFVGYPIQLNTNTALTGDYTIEAFVNYPVLNKVILGNDWSGSGNATNNQFKVDASGYLSVYTDTAGQQLASSQPLSVGQWYHIALSRSGSTLYFWVDGVAAGTGTSSDTFNFEVIGALGGYTSGASMLGYISNLRVSNNARYTSAFTAPTSDLSADANTLLLALQGTDPFTDQSGNYTLTVSNTVKASTFGPYYADAGEGGLVWIKDRDAANGHNFYDTERGATKRLSSNLDSAETTRTNGVTSFNSNGFSGGNDASINTSGNDYASWTFRKAPKFFTCLTYSGTGSAQNISHDLGAVPGIIIVKRTSNIEDWNVYHRSLGNGYYLQLNGTNAASVSSTTGGAANLWNDTDPTDSVFSVGTHARVNTSGETYVAYLFAHNDGDGTFGPAGDQDIIKCGSYTGNGSSTNPVDVGFEPQWLMVKRVDQDSEGYQNYHSWIIQDNMRGFYAPPYTSSSGEEHLLFANSNVAEGFRGDTVTTAGATHEFLLTNTGFDVAAGTVETNRNGATYIYIAIRRGPMAVPTDATDVFDVFTTTNAQPAGIYGTVGPVDLNVNKKTDQTYSWRVFDRLRNDYQLNFDSTNADNARDWVDFDEMTGININATGAGALLSDSQVHYNWKRAPSFCDVVAYTGNGTAGRTVSHNLGVAPEMMWVKKRNATGAWPVYHVGAHATSPENYFLQLNSTITATLNSARWNNTAPTATEFTVGNGGTVNDLNDTYIAYLFASVDGVSKLGSFTHTSGTATNVDCGFSNGARFVLLKYYDQASDWWVFDTVRGIAVGNDARLILNQPYAETSTDQIDPYSAGFTYDAARASGDIIFYAIA